MGMGMGMGMRGLEKNDELADGGQDSRELMKEMK